jgi:protein-S-isoprenylcysteine O-methyltransferase Ste14
LQGHEQAQPAVEFPEKRLHFILPGGKRCHSLKQARLELKRADLVMENSGIMTAMTLPLLIQFLLCPVVLLSLLKVTAPYGRHFEGGWGPVLPNRRAWFWMEIPAVLVIGKQLAAWVPLLFWQLHYLYRTFVFPALMRPSDKTFPALLVVFAIAFNTLNGYNNAAALLQGAQANETLSTAHFWAGLTVFLAGFATHVWSDTIIRRLRKPGDTGYRVPEGGLFRWVSSPHYLGEIVQWIGWAVMTWSLAGLAFALFTFCNLAPRAVSNHAWYRRRFPDYPRQRRVLVPGIF